MQSDINIPQRLYTVQEAADYLGVSPALVYRLAADRQIFHVRVGIGRGTIRFKLDHLEEFKRSRERKPCC